MSNSPSEDPVHLFSQLMASLPTLPPPDPDYEEKRLAKIKEEEERQQKEALDHRWSLTNVPERHAKTRPEITGEWGEAWKRLEPRLGNGCIIPITGTRGSGKTQLAVQAIRYVCKKGGYCSYTKAMEIFLDIREAMGSKDKSEKEAIRAYTTQRLLVIDAMEVRGETEFENRVLDYIIDMRYDSGLDTILISNQKKEEFTKSLGPSIISRIHESGELIECVWTSFRESGDTEYKPRSIEDRPGRVGDSYRLKFL